LATYRPSKWLAINELQAPKTLKQIKNFKTTTKAISKNVVAVIFINLDLSYTKKFVLNPPLSGGSPFKRVPFRLQLLFQSTTYPFFDTFN